MKKLKKLKLKKQVVANLNNFEMDTIKGGDCTIQRYMTNLISHHDPADCFNGCVGTDASHCPCSEDNGGGSPPSDNCTGFYFSAHEVWTCGPNWLSYNCNTDEAVTFCCY